MLENFKRKKDDAKRISLLADAAVEWWVKKISGEEPHDNGSNDFTSFAACRMADMGRKKITEKQLFVFKEVLRGEIEVSKRKCDCLILGCDYGPDKNLGFAAEQAGINFLNFPFKTWMAIKDDKIEVHEGYAAPEKVIFEITEKMQ